MAWLWIISVGVTDIQFPVWSKDTYGQWTGPRRFETGRAGIRAVHEGLLALLHRDQIRFESGEPEAVRNARDLRLEFFQEDGAFLAAIRPEEYRISRWADTIPNDREDRLPLYCPKVEALLPIARETFAGGPVTVLVLNTRRAVDFREGPGEPIAAGPLVAKFLAERLSLQWHDGQGQVPTDLGLGISTWVDILTGDEATEDADAQGNLIRRLNAAIRAWNPGGGSRQVVVTTSGGIPPLKPIIERVPATAVGQSNVLLLDQPQGGKAAAVPLSYDTRVTERETLRFQCAESLRLGDYASAYGLANRAAKQPWAHAVRDGLGALLELPGKPLILSERRLEPYAVCACQIEASLCMGDSAGALVRFGTFIDSTIWALIAGDARIREARLKPDREDECLVGQMLGSHALFEQRLLELNSKGPNRHGVMGLTWRWPQWLAQRAGGQLHASQAIDRLRLAYNGEPRRFRNLLIHGAAEPVDLNEVRRCMRDAGLIAADNLRFGQNFLSTPMLSDLLTGLGSSDLASGIGSQLQNLLNRVIEG
jgi:hypothetical protein